MPKVRRADVQEKIFDLLVVGAGPAGAACALQAKRDGLDVLVVGDEPIGGLIRAARRLDNLPALPGINGAGLAELLHRQLTALDVLVVRDRIESLWVDHLLFRAEGAEIGRVTARSVCLATGTRPVDYPLEPRPGSLLRDARQLPDSLVDQKVVVVGGGEAALDTALTARDRGAEVRILVRSDRLRSNQSLIEEAESSGVRVKFQSRVMRVSGRTGDWSIELCDHEVVRAHFLVVCVGRTPGCALLQKLTRHELAQSVVQPELPGVFLAGDLIRGRQRYVASAFGDGQRAAIEAFGYLEEKKTCWIR